MLKRSLGVIVFLWLFAAPQAEAAAPACPKPKGYAQPQVKVVTVLPPVQYNRTLSVRQITRMHREADSNGKSHDANTLGLTVSKFTAQWNMDFLAAKLGNGSNCIWLRTIEIKLAVPEVTVYVASEYQPGNCEYNAVLAHENEHVRINAEVMTVRARTLEMALKGAVGKLAPLVSKLEPQAAVEKELGGLVQRNLAELNAERDRRNAAIDSDHSYGTVARKCRNW